jgi:hypothetical protein
MEHSRQTRGSCGEVHVRESAPELASCTDALEIAFSDNPETCHTRGRFVVLARFHDGRTYAKDVECFDGARRLYEHMRAISAVESVLMKPIGRSQP